MFMPKGMCSNLFLLFCVLFLYTVQCSYILDAVLTNGNGHDSEFEAAQIETFPKLSRTRSKRWDYGADGCHCSGYSVECLQDLYCQRKLKNPMWTCQKNCCGFKCVKTE